MMMIMTPENDDDNDDDNDRCGADDGRCPGAFHVGCDGYTFLTQSGAASPRVSAIFVSSLIASSLY